MRPSTWLESVNCAIEGILWAVKSQRHMRIHFLAAAAVLLLALFCRVTPLDFVLLVFAVVLVLVAELANTALEVVVDLASPDFHLLARRAKDVAAGSVLVGSVGAAITGFLILGPYLFPTAASARSAPSVGSLAVFSLLIVIILVVLLKGCFGTGTPLHGGMPSGHAAVAFSIATSLHLAMPGTVLSILVLAMAVMVSHSRLLMDIHSLREVLAGALLGAGVTFSIYLLFG